MEEFKICIEDYEVSNFGNVRKKLKNGEYKIINCSITNVGYKYFQLNRNKKRKNYMIHQLVALHFIGMRSDNKVIDHIDLNPLNNNVSNLRYVSQKENCYNHPRVNKDVEEKDPKLRRKIIQKIYNAKNVELIKEKKKLYYAKNKEKFTKYNDIKFKVICSKCKNEREIKKSQYLKIKREEIENNICRSCQAKINLNILF
jgi:hypothetical protein